MTIILGVRLDNRAQSAMEFQKTLTEFGCYIKTRIGLHGVADGICSPNGVILLDVIDENECIKLEAALSQIAGIEIQKMRFS